MLGILNNSNCGQQACKVAVCGSGSIVVGQDKNGCGSVFEALENYKKIKKWYTQYLTLFQVIDTKCF